MRIFSKYNTVILGVGFSTTCRLIDDITKDDTGSQNYFYVVKAC